MEKTFRRITKLIKSHKNIIIVTHSNPDLDGFGSSIVMSKIISSFDIENYIYFDKTKSNTSIDKMLNKINEFNIKINTIDQSSLTTLDLSNTLLIVLDTHKESMLDCKELLNKINDIIVIDHHIKGQGYIKNTIINYINSSSSSVSEIMVNYLKYLGKLIEPMLATVLLAAIEIDTNGFNLKTTDKTYESAAYLIKIGADNIEKQELLKQSKDDYIKQQDFVKNSYMINTNMAMCTLDSNIYEPKDLATISEQLLQFEDVEASFTIGYIEKNKIGISARSIGKIDVEKIMTELGGGGHTTNAATQINGKTISEARDLVFKIVNKR